MGDFQRPLLTLKDTKAHLTFVKNHINDPQEF